MNTMRYKLVAADVDGTLIDDNGQISEHTARTIKKAIDNGLLFTIATGRSLSSITHFINGIRHLLSAYYKQRCKNCCSRR